MLFIDFHHFVEQSEIVTTLPRHGSECHQVFWKTRAAVPNPGKKEVVAALLGTGVELNLFEASATGQEERVKALLEKQPNLVKTHSPDGFSALGLAVFFGQKRAAEMLLAKGAPVNEASKH